MQCLFFSNLAFIIGTLCASFLTNLVTSGLVRWRCQSGSSLWRPSTGLFSNSFSISCLLYPVLKAIELLFTGRSLPPMMRIGSTSAQLPWPATCTSGLASFYTFCAPYLWCAHIYLENNVTLNHLRSEKKLLCNSTSKQGEDEFRLTFLWLQIVVQYLVDWPQSQGSQIWDLKQRQFKVDGPFKMLSVQACSRHWKDWGRGSLKQ